MRGGAFFGSRLFAPAAKAEPIISSASHLYQQKVFINFAAEGEKSITFCFPKFCRVSCYNGRKISERFAYGFEGALEAIFRI